MDTPTGRLSGSIRVAALVAVAASSMAGAARAQEGSAAATVTVENARAVPVVVYLERGPFDVRLGTVAAHATNVLGLPAEVRDQEHIVLMVHPEGGMDLQAEAPMPVRKAGTIHLYVPTNDVGYVPPPPPDMIPNPGPGTTTLTVQNSDDEPVVVFIEKGNFDTRIGTVPAHKEMTFYVPQAVIGMEGSSVDIFVHEEGGVDLASSTFELRPDAHLIVKVPA